ncbi:prepilin-type N-terminal cleavage/methylation domain-containing protein [Thermus thermophilus]|uniref:prepilin-type N-terminal cleavage/methylation domain-containing protein n=1 Tax=Thermus thermophilus TaxID=274 RepID=UPI0013FD959C|nr:prepilin-type N-terminal cleavage/methylation domain-containing protein [Thermus thermophilus]
MRRGFTLVELAVALALLGVLALGLSLLLGQMARGSQEAQEEAQLEADLQEIRARLTEDVLRSTAFTCTGAQATLTLPSGTVTYEVSGGRVLRQGQPLTELSGYGGSFSCSGPTLTLTLSWGSAALPPIRATRRVGLNVTSAPLTPDDVPIQDSGRLTGNGRGLRNITWENQSGQTLYLKEFSVLEPAGNEVRRVELRKNNNRILDNRQRRAIPVSYTINPLGVINPGDELRLQRLDFEDPANGQTIRLAFHFCLDNGCTQEAVLEYALSCTGDRNSTCTPL